MIRITGGDGDCDQSDIFNIDVVPVYDVRCDLDLDLIGGCPKYLCENEAAICDGNSEQCWD